MILIRGYSSLNEFPWGSLQKNKWWGYRLGSLEVWRYQLFQHGNHPLTSPVRPLEANKRTLGHWKAVGGSGRSGGCPGGSSMKGPGETMPKTDWEKRHVGCIYLTYSDPISSSRIYLYVCLSVYESIYLSIYLSIYVAIYPKYIFGDVCEWLQMLIWEWYMLFMSAGKSNQLTCPETPRDVESIFRFKKTGFWDTAHPTVLDLRYI